MKCSFPVLLANLNLVQGSKLADSTMPGMARLCKALGVQTIHMIAVILHREEGGKLH